MKFTLQIFTQVLEQSIRSISLTEQKLVDEGEVVKAGTERQVVLLRVAALNSWKVRADVKD